MIQIEVPYEKYEDQFLKWWQSQSTITLSYFETRAKFFNVNYSSVHLSGDNWVFEFEDEKEAVFFKLIWC